ncbi:thioredoxin family protein [Cellulophaga sp. Hel_I_12]|uniref:thioredoxin family protein n=1 Tax=Cellulophaga sp. Hel_I_12 TaxID=1249972 RepID=UPI000648861C|nr:thioredoxin family protein [Cellulophaga sp. Hel_I_12]
MKVFLTIFIVFFLSPTLFAQPTEIKWLTFEQLEDSLALKPKKVFVDFYADWCVYCKKMDEAAYKNVEVIKILTTEYYAVKMNAESRDTIIFDGQAYRNTAYGKKRNPVHEIPLLLASREGIPFSLPAILLFDKNFQITKRYFEYISPKKMLNLLEN